VRFPEVRLNIPKFAVGILLQLSAVLVCNGALWQIAQDLRLCLGPAVKIGPCEIRVENFLKRRPVCICYGLDKGSIGPRHCLTCRILGA
jgi:hypothetical protein